METYRLSYKKNITNKNSSVRRTKQNRSMLISNYAARDKKNSRFIKNQEASRLKLQYSIFYTLNCNI